MIRYTYNQQLVPPAPLVHVALAHPDRPEEGIECPAQLDTAADRTVIPEPIAGALSLYRVRELVVEGLGGHESRLVTYAVRVMFREGAPMTAEVFACPGEPFVLLGRDILNRFRIVLDGPQLMCEIH